MDYTVSDVAMQGAQTQKFLVGDRQGYPLESHTRRLVTYDGDPDIVFPVWVRFVEGQDICQVSVWGGG